MRKWRRGGTHGSSAVAACAFLGTGRQAASGTPATKDGLAYAGMPGGFVIEAPGLAAIYHAGDTDVFSDMKLIHELYAPKIIMLPIGDHYTMGPRGAAIAAKYFDPATIIPIHYGTFPALTGTVDAFNQHLGPDLANRVVAMDPGDSVAWTDSGTTGR